MKKCFAEFCSMYYLLIINYINREKINIKANNDVTKRFV